MRMNKITVTFVAAAVALTMAGCGSSTGASTAGEEAVTAATEGYTAEEVQEPGPVTTASEAMTEPPQGIPDGQNPAMNYVGAYSDENGKAFSLFLEVTDDEDDVKVMIGHMDDEGIYYSWILFGQIRNNVITYTDGACYKAVPDAQSATGLSEETVYEDGTGTLTISQDSKITWSDDKENMGDGVVFVWDQALYDELQKRAEEAQN